jgi:hypothetical protein
MARASLVSQKIMNITLRICIGARARAHEKRRKNNA